ncbi:hypothetical protein SDIAM103S_03558 [Streptomyces diastaticus subsp. diastaticus]
MAPLIMQGPSTVERAIAAGPAVGGPSSRPPVLAEVVTARVRAVTEASRTWRRVPDIR